MGRVPLPIPREFWIPILLIGFRRAPVAALLGVVTVPETAMYEDRLALPKESKVRFTRQVLPMKAVSESHTVHEPAHQKLWLRVLASDAAHIFGALSWGNSIGHGGNCWLSRRKTRPVKKSHLDCNLWLCESQNSSVGNRYIPSPPLMRLLAPVLLSDSDAPNLITGLARLRSLTAQR